jgi:hypothetical protein
MLTATQDDDVGWVGAVEGADLHAGGRVVLTGFVGAATVTIFGSG